MPAAQGDRRFPEKVCGVLQVSSPMAVNGDVSVHGTGRMKVLFRETEKNMEAEDTKRQMLRHTVATLAYRGNKVVRGVPEGFDHFHANGTVRTPIQILAHLGDLLEWALSLACGESRWHDTEPQSWDREVDRFFVGLKAFDRYLSSEARLEADPEKLFQGPVADALTHVGQIALLRRLAGAPVRGENYFVADIATGVVGPDQPPPRREFD